MSELKHLIEWLINTTASYEYRFHDVSGRKKESSKE